MREEMREEQQRWPTEDAHAWTVGSPGRHAGSPDPDRLASPRALPRATAEDSPGCRRRTSAAVGLHASPLRRCGLVLGVDGPLPGTGEIHSPVKESDELRGLRIAQTHRSQLARGTRPPPLERDWLGRDDDEPSL